MNRNMGDTEFLRRVDKWLLNKRSQGLKIEDARRTWAIANASLRELASMTIKRAQMQGLIDTRHAQVTELGVENDKLRKELREKDGQIGLLQKQLEEARSPISTSKTINESIAGIGLELREAVYLCNNSGMMSAGLAFQHVLVALGAAEDAATEADAGDLVVDV